MQPLLVYDRIYADESLHLASLYVRHYLATAQLTDWFHVMIRAIAYPSFLDAMDADPESHALPYSCWCDGGDHPDARYRHHRHLIVVSPATRFDRTVWPNIRAGDDAPGARHGGPTCKRARPIRSALSLVKTLGDLSHPTTQCRFSFRKSRAPFRDHHFLILQSLPRDYALPLVVLWSGGLRSWLHDETFSRAEAARIAEHPLEYRKGRWRQKLKDFYGLERGLVLPLCAHLVPTLDEPTPFFLHLFTPGHKLYFKLCPPADDASVWISAQAEGGNCFYEVVHEDFWVPGPSVQQELDRLVPLHRRVRALTLEHAEVLREKEELEQRKAALERERVVELDDDLQTGELVQITGRLETKTVELEKVTAVLENQRAQLPP